MISIFTGRDCLLSGILSWYHICRIYTPTTSVVFNLRVLSMSQILYSLFTLFSEMDRPVPARRDARPGEQRDPAVGRSPAGSAKPLLLEVFSLRQVIQANAERKGRRWCVLRYVNGAVGNVGISHVDRCIAEFFSFCTGQAHKAKPRWHSLHDIGLPLPLKPAHW